MGLMAAQVAMALTCQVVSPERMRVMVRRGAAAVPLCAGLVPNGHPKGGMGERQVVTVSMVIVRSK